MTTASERQTKLLWEASKWLEEARDPLHLLFFQEHDVTSTECLDMADQMALALKIFIVLTNNSSWTKTLGMLLGEATVLDLELRRREERETS